MPSLVVRNLDEALINALKARAVKHHRSTESEHRAILAEALLQPKRKSFTDALLSIPDAGLDSDFQRVEDEATFPNVFDWYQCY